MIEQLSHAPNLGMSILGEYVNMNTERKISREGRLNLKKGKEAS